MTKQNLTTEGGLAAFTERASLEELHELAEFAQVTPATALGWTAGVPLPKGETLIRLQHYLAFKGLKPEELKQLPQMAFRLGQLIALGVVDAKRATDEMGYSSTTTFYRIFQGAELPRERVAILKSMLDEYAAELATALENITLSPLGGGVVTSDAPKTGPVSDSPIKESRSEYSANHGSQPSFAATHVAGTLLTAGAFAQQLVLMDTEEAATICDLVGYPQLTELIENLSAIVEK